MTEGETAGWHHWVNGHESEQTLGNREDWCAAVHEITKSLTRLSNEQTQQISENVLFVFSFVVVLWCHVLYLILLAILILFLCMVWGSVLTSLIYIQLSSFPNTTFWRDCLFSIAYSWLLLKINWLQTCEFISGVSILFHWSKCLFLFQYHVVLITVTLKYCLKSVERLCL